MKEYLEFDLWMVTIGLPSTGRLRPQHKCMHTVDIYVYRFILYISHRIFSPSV